MPLAASNLAAGWVAGRVAFPPARRQRGARAILKAMAPCVIHRTGHRVCWTQLNGSTFGPMALTVGIIGLPQSGKTTLFNALKRAGADISGYPTSTVQANRAVVEVPAERLGTLADIFHPRKVVPATVEFVDVAGIGQATEGAKREGLSAEVLGHIPNAAALAIVVRRFNNPPPPHPPASIAATRRPADLPTQL